MKKHILILITISVIVLSPINSAQDWIARYNGPGNSVDHAKAIAVDNAGNVYVTGKSMGSSTYYDYATIKYDSLGVEKWVVRYDGPGNGDDVARAIVVNNSCNIYVTGKSFGFNTDYDFATVKYDSSGVEQWIARYNGSDNSSDSAIDIVIDKYGNIYVTGSSTDSINSVDYVTVKYDSLGVEQWVARSNLSPFPGADHARALAVDIYGSVYVTGINAQYDYATVGYDSSGVEKWVASYNGPCSNWDEAKAIAVDNAGNVYVTGKSRGSNPNTTYDYATIKYDSLGVEKWVTRYDGPVNNDDLAYAIAIDNACNIYVTGQSRGLTHWDYATIKYDSSSAEQWVARYSGAGYGWDEARAIAIDSACNIYVTGWSYDASTSFDYGTVKYDSSGVEKWVARYNGPGNSDDHASAIVVDNTNNVFVTGWSFGSGTDDDYATIKYSSTYGIEEEKNVVIKKGKTVATIFSGHLVLPEDKNCKVFDITGRVVEPTRITRGIYFIEIDGVVTQKVVKVR